MPRAGNGGEPPSDLPDAMLWRRSRITEAPESEEQLYLDLAGFADGLLDPDERERVAERLAGDPAAAGDVAAARALAATVSTSSVSETVAARACALIGGGEPRIGRVMPFVPRPRPEPGLRRVAGWGSLVAAMAVASWLGFTLGVDTTTSLSRPVQATDDGYFHELLDPSGGFMRDLTESTQT
jgi:anti-sigma factor RsiW